MGANAQTSVPTFTAGEVLTAANMNISARTGVPVFADTTARDAAFGGTGEKTLAEGQLCYVENLTGVAQLQYYDGSTWTSLTQPGLVRLTSETAFTAASSVTVDNVFTSSYTHYRLNVRYTTSTNNGVLYRNRVGGSSAATAYNNQFLQGAASTASATRSTGQTSFTMGRSTEGTFYSSFTADIFGPQLAQATTFQVFNAGSPAAYTANDVLLWFGNHETATAYDGFELLTGSGTITGSYTVYGYAK